MVKLKRQPLSIIREAIASNFIDGSNILSNYQNIKIDIHVSPKYTTIAMFTFDLIAECDPFCQERTTPGLRASSFSSGSLVNSLFSHNHDYSLLVENLIHLFAAISFCTYTTETVFKNNQEYSYVAQRLQRNTASYSFLHFMIKL